ncbi:MAG: hypothetical protein ACRELX_04145 [Longimicrobiales bacterium]
MKHRILTIAAASLLAVAPGCDQDAELTDPSMTAIAGDWEARGDHGVFLYRAGGLTTDVLGMGGYVTLALEADGTASGRLFVPSTTGDDLDVPFLGTWMLDEIDDFDEDVAVEIDTPAELFLRDVKLEVASENRLEANENFLGGENVLLVLVRR